jgi:hypothetical protein
MSVDIARRTGCAVLHHFRWAFIVTALGLISGAVVSWNVIGAMHGTHLSVAAFGGAFLMMVFPVSSSTRRRTTTGCGG